MTLTIVVGLVAIGQNLVFVTLDWKSLCDHATERVAASDSLKPKASAGVKIVPVDIDALQDTTVSQSLQSRSQLDFSALNSRCDASIDSDSDDRSDSVPLDPEPDASLAQAAEQHVTIPDTGPDTPN